jgi:hypothetical protein
MMAIYDYRLIYGEGVKFQKTTIEEERLISLNKLPPHAQFPLYTYCSRFGT